MKRIVGAAGFAGAVAIGLVGCNTILDNEPGTLAYAEDASATEPPGETPSDDAGGSQLPPISGSEDDAGDATPPDENGDCPQGQHLCQGTCVSLTDPLYGCGDPSCKPCSAAHGTSACQGRTCVVAECDPGYADCNAKPKDGCERDLTSDRHDCGACGVRCVIGRCELGRCVWP